MSKDNNGPPVLLDEHRGMTAQVETEARRHSSAVEADQQALRQARSEMEAFLFAVPAASWPEAAEKAKYLLRLFSTTAEAQDPRQKQLIEATLEDFGRLGVEPGGGA
ncbi:MAG TPA: hypothetical protein VG742_16965 [Dongiaceae bacterium]|nr:hypothetical protein [Dongiaceae bacterium]